jgi:hypothetical protein
VEAHGFFLQAPVGFMTAKNACHPGHLWFSEVEIISFQSDDLQFQFRRRFEGVSNCRLELN